MPSKCHISALVLLSLIPLGAAGQAAPATLTNLTIDQLKTLYLVCNSAANDGRLRRGEIELRSIVYEDLKLRAFGGDFEKLLAWSRTQPVASKP